MSDDNKLSYAVKIYLQKNPDFFVKNPELLTTLDVVSSKGELADLTTHQLKSLQQENRKLKAQLAQLINNAQQSETLMDRLLMMVTELAMTDKTEFLPGFVNYVKTHFSSDYFKLLLAEGVELSVDVEDVETLNAVQKTHFSVFQAKSEPVSGRLKQEKIQSIFGTDKKIKSAIVLPVGQQAKFGLMSFASKDEEKFHPHSSSDILQKLCQILASYFSQQNNVDAHQAMS
ncbi:MAG: DUF484 family protein [Marinicella sp.]|nr:DUF484 family protein [Xanthomonadales bacterium]